MPPFLPRSTFEDDDVVFKMRTDGYNVGSSGKSVSGSKVKQGYRIASKTDATTNSWYDTDCEARSTDQCNGYFKTPFSAHAYESGDKMDDYILFGTASACTWTGGYPQKTASGSGWKYVMDFRVKHVEMCNGRGKWSEEASECCCNGDYFGQFCELRPCGDFLPEGCVESECVRHPDDSIKCSACTKHYIHDPAEAWSPKACACRPRYSRKEKDGSVSCGSCATGYEEPDCKACDALHVDVATKKGAKSVCEACPRHLANGDACLSKHKSTLGGPPTCKPESAEVQTPYCACDDDCVEKRFHQLVNITISSFRETAVRDGEPSNDCISLESADNFASIASLGLDPHKTRSHSAHTANVASALAFKSSQLVRDGMDAYGFPLHGVRNMHPRNKDAIVYLLDEVDKAETHQMLDNIVDDISSLNGALVAVAEGHADEASQVANVRSDIIEALKGGVSTVIATIVALFEQSGQASKSALASFLKQKENQIKGLYDQLQKAKNEAIFRAVLSAVEIGVSVVAIVGTGGAAAPLVAARMVAARAVRSQVGKFAIKTAAKSSVKVVRKTGRRALKLARKNKQAIKKSGMTEKQADEVIDNVKDIGEAAFDIFGAYNDYQDKKEAILAEISASREEIKATREFFENNKATFQPKCPKNENVDMAELCEVYHLAAVQQEHLYQGNITEEDFDGCSMLHLSVICLSHADSGSDRSPGATDRLRRSVTQQIGSMPIVLKSIIELADLPKQLAAAVEDDHVRTKVIDSWTRLQEQIAALTASMDKMAELQLAVVDMRIKEAVWTRTSKTIADSAGGVQHKPTKHMRSISRIRDVVHMFRRMDYYMGFSRANREEFFDRIYNPVSGRLALSDGLRYLQKYDAGQPNAFHSCQSLRFSSRSKALLLAMLREQGGGGSTRKSVPLSVSVTLPDSVEQCGTIRRCDCAFYNHKVFAAQAYVLGADRRSHKSGAPRFVKVTVMRDEHNWVVDHDGRLRYFEMYGIDSPGAGSSVIETAAGSFAAMARPPLTRAYFPFQSGYSLSGNWTASDYFQHVTPVGEPFLEIKNFLAPSAIGSWDVNVHPSVFLDAHRRSGINHEHVGTPTEYMALSDDGPSEAGEGFEFAFELGVMYMVNMNKARKHCRDRDYSPEFLKLEATVVVGEEEFSLGLGQCGGSDSEGAAETPAVTRSQSSAIKTLAGLTHDYSKIRDAAISAEPDPFGGAHDALQPAMGMV